MIFLAKNLGLLKMQVKIDQNDIEKTTSSLDAGMHICLDTKHNSITGYVTKTELPSTVRLSEEPFERAQGFFFFMASISAWKRL